MLVVKVELHPHGDSTPENVTELARMIIANDGTGTPKLGNYWGRAAKGTIKGDHMIAPAIMHESRKLRDGTVRDYPRQSKHVWNLVARMLKSMGFA